MNRYTYSYNTSLGSIEQIDEALAYLATIWDWDSAEVEDDHIALRKGNVLITNASDGNNARFKLGMDGATVQINKGGSLLINCDPNVFVITILASQQAFIAVTKVDNDGEESWGLIQASDRGYGSAVSFIHDAHNFGFTDMTINPNTSSVKNTVLAPLYDKDTSAKFVDVYCAFLKTPENVDGATVVLDGQEFIECRGCYFKIN